MWHFDSSLLQYSKSFKIWRICDFENRITRSIPSSRDRLNCHLLPTQQHTMSSSQEDELLSIVSHSRTETCNSSFSTNACVQASCQSTQRSSNIRRGVGPVRKHPCLRRTTRPIHESQWADDEYHTNSTGDRECLASTCSSFFWQSRFSAETLELIEV